MKVARSPFAMVPLWVYDHPAVTRTVLDVYMALAVGAHERKASRSVAQLMDRTGLKRAAVYAALATLRDIRAALNRPNGSLFLPLDPPEDLSPQVDESMQVDSESMQVDDLSTQVDEKSMYMDSSVSRDLARDQARELRASSTSFEAFYAAYPLHIGKGAALKAWQAAVRKAPPEVIIAGARRYRDDPNRDPAYTKQPGPWLNAERWDDDPLPPRRANGNTVPMRQSVGDANLARLRARQAEREAPNGRLALDPQEARRAT